MQDNNDIIEDQRFYSRQENPRISEVLLYTSNITVLPDTVV